MIKTQELVEQFAERGYTKKAARLILRDFTEIITDNLINGEDIQIYGLGTFAVRESKIKEMNILGTGERRVVQPHMTPRFMWSESLRKAIRHGYREEDGELIDAEDQ